MSSVFDFISPEELIALDMLHDAAVYLNRQFDIRMARAEAKANLDARALIFNCSNLIFKAHQCGISRAEVEGAAIIERAMEGGD